MIDISDDDDADDLVIIDEKVGKKSNKGKTFEAINQVVPLFSFFLSNSCIFLFSHIIMIVLYFFCRPFSAM